MILIFSRVPYRSSYFQDYLTHVVSEKQHFAWQIMYIGPKFVLLLFCFFIFYLIFLFLLLVLHQTVELFNEIDVGWYLACGLFRLSKWLMKPYYYLTQQMYNFVDSMYVTVLTQLDKPFFCFV